MNLDGACILGGAPTVREGLLQDERSVTELWRSCGLVASYNDPVVDYAFALEGSSSTVLLAENGDGVVVGSVMVGHDGHRGWLYYVAVEPGSRRRGFGRTLIEAAEDWLRPRGVRKVQLLIRPRNDAVADFYARLGYEDMPRVVMSRWIQGQI